MSIAIVLTVLIFCKSDDDSDSNQSILTSNWRPDKIGRTKTSGETSTTIKVVTDQGQQKRQDHVCYRF